ncbi:unnamed protein product [Rhizoctonia solani]|uniref:Uncharacterized protein n=1 Tax=Rhizoctonia solani TaxID=456999 RepID=A0A8H3A822_9AGAM|nr:unnamed protein product [Rhizoctonia solani]
MWEFAQDLGPRVIWPPEDLEDPDNFDPEGAMPNLHRSIIRLNEKQSIEPIFREVCDFYSDFMTRVFYDYSLVSKTLVEWMLQRYKLSDSAKHGMLATIFLIRSQYERSMLADPLRKRAKEFYSLATHRLSRELDNISLSPLTKLAGLTEIMNYEYNAGNLPNYYAHGDQAAPLVKLIMGGETIDLLNLCGEQTFDVRFFAWWDIMSSMSTSRPTRFKYISNLAHATQSNISQESGIEWICGCPNVLAILLARTTALRHAQLPYQEMVSRGSELEQIIRDWQFHPLWAKASLLRVARICAQEIWRHTGILYVHHAIFRSDASHPLVKDSVKNIIKLAATLKPGGTPDCFLAAPYFINLGLVLAEIPAVTLTLSLEVMPEKSCEMIIWFWKNFSYSD